MTWKTKAELPLTPLMEQTLDYMRLFFIANDRYPSLRDHSHHFLVSKRTIKERLDSMAARGVIARPDPQGPFVVVEKEGGTA